VRSPAPFARSTLTAVGDDHLWIGDNERYEVGVHGEDGRLRRLIRRTAAPRKVSDGEKDEYRRAWRERVGSGGSVPHAAQERFLAEMPFPETHPAFSALHVDSEGRLWVRERDDAAGSHWAVHDGDGKLTGSVTLPPRAEPLDIAAHHVVARWTDEDGVEFVRVYRFEP
jgi:streptogramin lyase